MAMTRDWDQSADVIVVGSGAGGLSAAIRCARAGLDVLVLEKTPFYGGSTAISGGVVWIPENSLMAECGSPDIPGTAKTYLRHTLGEQFNEALIDAFLEQGPKMVDYFRLNTDVQLVPRMYAPDYQSEVEGASYGGRALDPAVFDGRELGDWFPLLRAPLPQMTIFGGMMVSRYDIDHLTHLWRRWSSFRHGVSILLRHAVDRLRYPRGTRLLAGNALAGRLLKSAVDAGVRLRNLARVEALLSDDTGAATGVEVNLGGQVQRIAARRGVVLASGGFAANKTLARESVACAESHLTMAPEGSEGDGLRMVKAMGGQCGSRNHNPVLLTPVSVLRTRRGEEVRFPHLILDRQKPGLIAVNHQGQRFVNEANSYHSFVEGMYHGRQAAETIPAYLICDACFLSRYGLGLARPWPFPHGGLVRNGYLLCAPTPAQLAEKIGVPADNLKASIEANNRYAVTGVDKDFGRGSTEYNRYLGDPAHKPNPCIGP
ncbi:MAG: FAD-binding dehydrogenase, partial [Porticoccaceae bacterium]|nr:FAD-binding dehydrogenase [Porticoccaceae bacterium]